MLTPENESAAACVGALRRQLCEGRIWTDRRDAAEALTYAARIALLTLRERSTDMDRDVQAFCKKALAEVEADQRTSLEHVRVGLASFLEAAERVAGPTPPPASSVDAPEPSLDREAVEETVQEAADMIGASLEKGSRGLKARVSLGDRSQKIYIDFGRKDPDGRDILMIYTLCGRPSPERYRWALDANARLSYGALALAKVDNEEMLALVETRVVRAIRPDTLAASLRYVAEAGDRIERELGASDRH